MDMASATSSRVGVDPLLELCVTQIRLSAQRNAELEAENKKLRTRTAGLEAENEGLRERVAELEGKVAAERRAGKRQAAPFSKGEPKAEPKRAGRKAGEAYGTKAHRAAPDHVDEVVAVPAPDVCPDCGGRVVSEDTVCQWVEDIPPVVTYVTRYDIGVGRCAGCDRRVTGRDPGQTSDATGAAAAQIGPRAVALAAILHHELGVPHAKTAKVLAQIGGLSITAGGIVHALARAARRCAATDAALVEGIRHSPVVAADETGWRINGTKAWLWDFVGDGITVFRIFDGRGYDQAEQVLGEDFAGVLERDGWAAYRKFTKATHQSCYAHILRRCHDMIADAPNGHTHVPATARAILKDALALREARDAGRVDPEGLARQVLGLTERVDLLLAADATCCEADRKLVKHLRNERDALFTFLTTPGVQATNWRAEQGIRPIVVNRKHWGGNRTRTGADTLQVLASVLRSARQQHRDPVGILVPLLTSPTPIVADLVIPGRSDSRRDRPGLTVPGQDDPAQPRAA